MIPAFYRIPSPHSNYNDQSSELVKELRLMNQYLMERINSLQDRLVAMETWVKEEYRRPRDGK
jgi:hypothetical protein